MATYYNAVFIVLTKDASRIPRKAGGKTCLLQEMSFADTKEFVIFVDRWNAFIKNLKRENTKDNNGLFEVDSVGHDIGLKKGMIKELELLGQRMKNECENYSQVFKEIDELTAKIQIELEEIYKNN